MNGHAMTYKPSEQTHNENNIISLASQYRPEHPLDGAISLEIKVFIPIPASKPKWWIDAACINDIAPTKKPDIDNYVKQIMDCLTKLNFWHDDSQVVTLWTTKRYSDNPRWEVTITSFPQASTEKEYATKDAGTWDRS